MGAVSPSPNPAAWPCCKVEEWDARIDWLEETFPPRAPVVVRLTDSVTIADCDDDGHQFVIRINPCCRFTDAVNYLLHEWAHALTWDSKQPDHSDEWGITHARLYRADEAWCIGMDEEVIARYSNADS